MMTATEIAGLGAMTRLTELCATIPFVHEQGDLQSLTRLRHLALDYVPYQRGFDSTTYYPFVFPDAARINNLLMIIHHELVITLFAWIGFSDSLPKFTNP